MNASNATKSTRFRPFLLSAAAIFSAALALPASAQVPPPGAPTIGTATAGNAQVSVTFTAPSNAGGFVAQCRPVDGDVSKLRTGRNPASPVTVTGLANGTAYTCSVAVATGGTFSAASNSVKPTAPSSSPGAPTIGTATAGNAEVSVAFTAPSSDGGTPIRGYTATCNNTSTGATAGVARGTASPLTVKPLANGNAYTCRVAATNRVGVGAVSANSNSVTPVAPAAAAGTPAVPTNAVATAGSGQVSVSFTAPSNPGGYVAVCKPQNGNLSLTRTGRGPASPITVTGLANGTAYTCTVAVATGGTLSAASNSVTPAAPAAAAPSKPGAPVIGTATAGNGMVTVLFTPPASDGGSPITQYVASCYIQEGVDLGGTSSPLIVGAFANARRVTGLPNGTALACRVVAGNAVGFGPPSAESNRVTPTPPAAAAPSGSGVGTTNDAPASGG